MNVGDFVGVRSSLSHSGTQVLSIWSSLSSCRASSHPQDLAGRQGKRERVGFYMRFYELDLGVAYFHPLSITRTQAYATAKCIAFSRCVARRRMELGRHLASITTSCPRVESSTEYGCRGRSSVEPRAPIDLGITMRFQTEFGKLSFC